jgi:hypothetical protein
MEDKRRSGLERINPFRVGDFPPLAFLAMKSCIQEPLPKFIAD